MRFSKLLRTAAMAAALVVTYSASSAEAQIFNQAPEPANNRAIAIAQGKQIVGLAGKCLTMDDWDGNAFAAIRECDPNAINQRFKFENGQLKTSGKKRIIISASWDQGAKFDWENACLTASEQNRVRLVKCGAVPNSGMQRWDLKGTEIRSGVNCFDVAQSNPASGNVVIYWGCQGQANQRWTMR